MPVLKPNLSGLAAVAAVVVCMAFPAMAPGQADTDITGADPTGSSDEFEKVVPIPGAKKPERDQGDGGAAGDTAPAPAPAAGPVSTAAEPAPRRLPFTGIDLLTLTGLAMVLTGLGWGLRQMLRPPPPRF
jgi:hypothetical protein